MSLLGYRPCYVCVFASKRWGHKFPGTHLTISSIDIDQHFLWNAEDGRIVFNVVSMANDKFYTDKTANECDTGNELHNTMIVCLT